MRRSLRFAAALALAVLCTNSARAAIPGPMQDQGVTVTTGSAEFTTVAINVAKTTDAIFVQGWRFVTFELDYVNSAATAVTMTCTQSRTSGGTYRSVQALTMAGATANSDTLTWSQAVSGNESWAWTVTFSGYYYLKCTFTAVGGDASDTLTVAAVKGN